MKPFDFGHGSGQQSVFGSGSGIFSDQSGAILSTGSGTLSDSFMGLASNNAPRQDFQSVLDERDQLRAQLYVMKGSIRSASRSVSWACAFLTQIKISCINIHLVYPNPNLVSLTNAVQDAIRANVAAFAAAADRAVGNEAQ